MTSSTCRHGAIHLRQAMNAIQLNAAQIRTTMSQDTAFIIAYADSLANRRVIAAVVELPK
jgi:hypothetical protein